jgi:phosphoglycolate phosphatase
MTDTLAIFDLDGTLIDTAPDLIDSTNHVLLAHGFGAVPADVVRPFIGLGARRMLEAALAALGERSPESEVAALYAAYLAHYETRLARHSRPFPELLAALDDLEAAGVRLAVCTNKREALARKLLDALDLSARFVALTGGDTFAVAKPAPEHLWGTIELAGGRRERTVYVGDSRVDRETAANAAIPFVGLTYGYSDRPMEDLDPDRLVGPGEDVAAAILSLVPATAG